MNINGKSEQLASFSALGRKLSMLLSVSIILAVSLFYIAFIRLRFSFIPYLLAVLFLKIMNKC